MKRIFYLIVCLVVLSCDKDDVSLSDDLKLESYYALYMDYGPNIDPLYGTGESFPLVQLEYSKNKLVRRKGDFLLIFNSLGYVFNSIFYKEIVDEISYSKNKIFIEKKSYSPNINQLHNRLRTIDLSGDGLMIKKTILELGEGGSSDIDTLITLYTYDSEKLLKHTHSETRNSSYFEYFPDINGVKYFDDAEYYYSKDNLDSIVTIRRNFEEQTEIYKPNIKTVEVFSNYYNASNPTKNLFMFEETFKRSLSKNNYTSYKNSIYTYSNDGVLNSTPSSESGKTWEYAYDEEGNIILGL
ncbi:MAG: hypothetical protein ACM31G_00295 [Flavobacteriales bacterium]